MNNETIYTANGYGYFVNTVNNTVYILKHGVILATIIKQSLTAEGVAELAEGFGLLYDELLYTNSSYRSDR